MRAATTATISFSSLNRPTYSSAITAPKFATVTTFLPHLMKLGAEKPVTIQKKFFICGKCRKTIAYDPSNKLRSFPLVLSFKLCKMRLWSSKLRPFNHSRLIRPKSNPVIIRIKKANTRTSPARPHSKPVSRQATATTAISISSAAKSLSIPCTTKLGHPKYVILSHFPATQT